MEENKIFAWLARDRNDQLNLFLDCKPDKIEDVDNYYESYFHWIGQRVIVSMDKNYLPEITWDNSPIPLYINAPISK